MERGNTGFRVGCLVRETVEDGIGEENSWREEVGWGVGESVIIA